MHDVKRDGLLPIGMFSRASSLSIKTLRAYHEAGILVPAEVDRFSGYRLYTADQLADAAIVRRLRALDLPLEQVREVIHARDPELTRRILSAHQLAMRARLEETERIVTELQSGVVSVTHTPVHTRVEQAMHTVRIARVVSEAEFLDWIGHALERLAGFVAELGVTPTGPPGALYTPEIAEDGIENVVAFVPVAEPPFVPASEGEISIGEVPSASVAVLVHMGDYASMADTYRTLGAWIARNADNAGERIREWYLVGPADVDNPDQYRTEISWPIRSALDGARS
jgi:DNA-binding transcriptional MerR regulator